MTSDALRAGVLALTLASSAMPARAAEPNYPFEGTWIRANRACVSNAPLKRTYTARDVTFSGGHCTFRKVASSGSSYEIFEDCRRADRPGNFTETIRILGPDLIQMRRQAARLKIARPLRYARCAIAAPEPPKPAAAPAPHRTEPLRAPAEPRPAEPRPAEPKP